MQHPPKGHYKTSFAALKSAGVRSALSAAIALCLISALATNSQAAEEVGSSVRIKNTVQGSLGNRSLKARDPVFGSERISAARNSHGELQLNDRSKVLVGENSVISLDDFIVGSRGFSNGTIKVAKGAFRFITGNSPKGAFKVETPKSTIGVRGTLFDVYVAANGNTRVILFRGEVEVCSSSNCITTNRSCDIVDVDSNSAREAPYLRSGVRQDENETYDLTALQNRFRLGWRAPTAICDVRAALDPNRRRLITPDTGPRSPSEPDDDKGGKFSPPEPAPMPDYDECGGPYGC